MSAPASRHTDRLRDLVIVGAGRYAQETADMTASALAALRAERDAALEEKRRAVARLAEVSAERDRLLAAVVAQAEAATPLREALSGPPGYPADRWHMHISQLHAAWKRAADAVEALGRQLRGAR